MLISITSSMEHQRDNRNGLDASGLHVRAVADSTFEAMKRGNCRSPILMFSLIPCFRIFRRDCPCVFVMFQMQ